MLCVDRNIPIFGKIEDGNSSDKTINNEVLSHISKHMSQHGLESKAFIYIADSALVTEKNLKTIGDDTKFVTRLPATYKECSRVIKEAVLCEKWEDIGVLAVTKPTINRPATSYKGYENEVELCGKTYRAIVIHSSAHDKRRQKKIQKELKTNLELLESKCKKLCKKEFFCEKDAQKESKEIETLPNKYYNVISKIKEVPKYKSGRPKGGKKEVKEMRYRVETSITKNEEEVNRFKEEAGCFVLLNNIPEEGKDSYNSEEILKVYKDQHGIEQNFKFLKDPAIVNGIFLKTAERIEVLGLVLLMSLLIWRLIERTMRIHVEETGETLPGWKNSQTKRPTSFMLLTKFTGIVVIKIGENRMLSKPLTDQQKKYLYALKISEDSFINPGAAGNSMCDDFDFHERRKSKKILSNGV
ncbi:transposase [Candidatus Magnetomorum sp. HK-1]|nr:transposase [Candidatus Magnetomorum sp. HK-1]